MAPSCLRVQRYDKFLICANILIKNFKNFSFLYNCTIFASSKVTECSAVGSALRSGRRGRAFESPHSDTAKKSNAAEFLPRFLLSPTLLRRRFSLVRASLCVT